MAAASSIVLTNGTVFDGEQALGEGSVAIGDGIVEHVVWGDGSDLAGDRIDVDGAVVAPGFFDIQVNGGGGVLFNDSPDLETLVTMAGAHRRFGTTAMLPTFVTGPVEAMRFAAAAVGDARRDPDSLIAGIHFEGPVINPARSGVHERAHIREFDETLGAIFTAVDAPTLVTLAPERVSPSVIAELTAAGVRVSAGHTEASYAEMAAAAAVGMVAGTHVWNAMRPMTSRDPAAVGAMLQLGGLYGSVIADGYHLADETLALTLNCLGPDRAVLITDAMPSAAGGPAQFSLGPVEITVDSGRCTTPDGVLAGSSLDMAGAVRHCVNVLGCDLYDTIRMASTVPARLMGLDDSVGRIAPGRRARIAVLDDSCGVTATVVGRSVETYS